MLGVVRHERGGHEHAAGHGADPAQALEELA
jgi:hypothetical protein